jgi:hypothetical protein
MVSRILTHGQKHGRLYISSYLLRNAEMFDRVMKRGVFNMTRKQNDRACSGKHRIHLGRKKHACLGRRSRPCLCFFDHKGMVHYEFIAQGQTVNQQCYFELLTKLRECVRRKRLGLWPDKWAIPGIKLSHHVHGW